jgi:tetratricopeptide (TPR) repeat protein
MKKSRRPDQEPAYEAELQRATGSAREEVPALLREIDEAVALLAEVLETPEAERRALLQNGVRFQSLELCQLLEARSREAGFADPARAVELAELAVVAAERLDDAHYGPMLAEDARASAWAHLGNACRVAADLPRAEEAFGVAEEHLRRGGGDAYTEAQLLSFKASLRNTQGRFDEAARILDGAITIYRQARDRHEEGRALILKGMALGYDGQHKNAIRLIRRGLSRIDLLKEPRLLVAARHNLILFLTDGGHPAEAQHSLAETRRLYLDLGERMNLIRLRWLEGKIARELGQLDDAEAALLEARGAFLDQGIGIDAALVSLDLAVLYAQRGETAAIQRLAAEMVPVFQAGKVHPDALAAILLFRQAADTEQVNRALLDRIASQLQRTTGQR